jgi:hypothetical protein
MPICTSPHPDTRPLLTIRIEAFLAKRGQKNLASLVPGGSGTQIQNQGQHIGNGAAGQYTSTQNAPVTNAEVDRIVEDSRRAGTATPPVQPQQQPYQQGQQPYQARVQGQR